MCVPPMSYIVLFPHLLRQNPKWRLTPYISHICSSIFTFLLGQTLISKLIIPNPPKESSEPFDFWLVTILRNPMEKGRLNMK